MKKQLAIVGVIILLSTLVLSGCNEQKNPIISSFQVMPNKIEFGETAVLRWNVSQATSITIDNGIGTVTTSGNRTIIPTKTTTYTLTAKSSTKTVTATISIIVNQYVEKPNVTMIPSLYYIEITETKNAPLNQSRISINAINKNNTENQTSALGPTITDGNGNPTILGPGDIITFRNLSHFRVGELWDIRIIYNGTIIGQCFFKNPEGPYDTPKINMIQTESFITIIGIINGPVEQSFCSITATNTTSGTNQTSLIGASFTDRDDNSALLGISDQITFSNLGKFKPGDQWIIRLVYRGEIIGQCTFTKPTNPPIIPP